MLRSRIGRSVAVALALAVAVSGLGAAPAFAAAGVLTGVVSLATTATPAGAGEVRVEYSSVGSTSPLGEVLTDATGRYTIAGLEPGTYRLWFDYLGTGPYSDQWLGTNPRSVVSESVIVAAADVTRNQILQAPGTLSGRVAFETGPGTSRYATAGEVDIWVAHRTGSTPTYSADELVATTGADGRWSVTLPPGVYAVKATYDGTGDWASVWYHSAFDYPTTPRLRSPRTINSVTNGALPWQPMVIGKRVTVTGTVQLGYDRIPAGAGDVRLRVQQEQPDGTFTDAPGGVLTAADGSFAIPNVDPLPTRVIADYLGSGPYIAGQTALRDDPTDPYTVRLLAGYQIDGHVDIDVAGRAAEAGEVTVDLLPYYTSRDPIATVQTDANGDYSFGVVTALESWAGYHVRFRLDPSLGYPDWYSTVGGIGTRVASSSSPTSSSAATQRSVVVGGGTSLLGVVTDSDGQPIAGAEVQALSVKMNPGEGEYPYGPSYTATTAADGSYAVRGLPGGWGYHLSFDHADFVGYGIPTSFDGRAGERFEDVDVTLYRPARISGQIVTAMSPSIFAESEVQAYLWVWNDDLEDWDDPITLGAELDGTYASHDLAPGNYAVGVAYQGRLGFSLGYPEDVINLGEGEQVEVDPVTATPFSRTIVYRDYPTPDILARTSAGKLVVYGGRGDGGVYAARTIGTGWSSMTAVVQAGDVNLDGHPDVFARDKAGVLWLYRANGSGGWISPKVKIGTGWQSLGAIFSPGDFDGDGIPDLIARDSSGRLWLYPGNGAGKFRTRTLISSGWQKMTAIFSPGDFDLDGANDVIARDATGALWLYHGTGAGKLTAKVRFGTSTGWKSFTAIFSVGDLDDDGVPDVLVRDRAGGLYVYPGDGDAGFGARYKIASGWQSLSIAR